MYENEQENTSINEQEDSSFAEQEGELNILFKIKQWKSVDFIFDNQEEAEIASTDLLINRNNERINNDTLPEIEIKIVKNQDDKYIVWYIDRI